MEKEQSPSSPPGPPKSCSPWADRHASSDTAAISVPRAPAFSLASPPSSTDNAPNSGCSDPPVAQPYAAKCRAVQYGTKGIRGHVKLAPAAEKLHIRHISHRAMQLYKLFSSEIANFRKSILEITGLPWDIYAVSSWVLNDANFNSLGENFKEYAKLWNLKETPHLRSKPHED
ncbi:hypothetical protein HDU84_000382, partial [Entophlyctis sp. JEL0112]